MVELREPKVLIFADDPDRQPRLYACPTCGSVHSPAIYLATKENQHAAAMDAARDCYTCKTHNECSYCGEQCDKGWTACGPCRFQRKLDAAEEIPDDGGPYCAFDGDTGVDAFYAAVKAFNDAQRTQSWFGDEKRKIKVPLRDSDGSGEADETGTGSAEGDSAGPQDIAEPQFPITRGGDNET
jgi:hypothetical protein